MKKYNIRPLFKKVSDQKSVRFHIKNGDYFGTIATVLSLIEEEMRIDNNCSKDIQQALNNMKNDLVFLQNNYQISPKVKNKNKTPKGKLSNQ